MLTFQVALKSYWFLSKLRGWVLRCKELLHFLNRGCRSLMATMMQTVTTTTTAATRQNNNNLNKHGVFIYPLTLQNLSGQCWWNVIYPFPLILHTFILPPMWLLLLSFFCFLVELHWNVKLNALFIFRRSQHSTVSFFLSAKENHHRYTKVPI